MRPESERTPREGEEHQWESAHMADSSCPVNTKRKKKGETKEESPPAEAKGRIAIRAVYGFGACEAFKENDQPVLPLRVRCRPLF